MSLKNIVKKVNLDDEVVLLTLDMVTIEYFKRVTGKSFLTSLTQMNEMDEDILFPLIGGMLRSVEEPTEPLGMNFLYKYNPFSIIEILTPTMYELISTSMPKGTPTKGGKSRKK